LIGLRREDYCCFLIFLFFSSFGSFGFFGFFGAQSFTMGGTRLHYVFLVFFVVLFLAVLFLAIPIAIGSKDAKVLIVLFSVCWSTKFRKGGTRLHYVFLVFFVVMFLAVLFLSVLFLAKSQRRKGFDCTILSLLEQEVSQRRHKVAQRFFKFLNFFSLFCRLFF
jgi:flagellar basal body-associated protein FliL